MPHKRALKPRQRLGKYRIGKRIAEGGFAEVYQALDTIEGIQVALKIPRVGVDEAMLEDFRKEVRLTSRLDHPNVVSIKNAEYIGARFVIAYPLGNGNLEERLSRRLSVEKALDISEGMLAGLAHAHDRRVMHCDVKPENLLLFPGDRVRLTDFGLAKLSLRTLRASGSGTLGYVAPEQAMGRPSLRSDVFSAGLVIYRMLSGRLPEWPYEWPPRGHERLRKKISAPLVGVLKRAQEPDPKKRYEDARAMHEAFVAARKRHRSTRARIETGTVPRRASVDWKTVRQRQFQREHQRELGKRYDCKRCGGPVSEAMLACPWCGTGRKTFKDETSFPAACPRCKRGVKLDWAYCPWCYGAAIGPLSEREYRDKRYTARCARRGCERRDLMPFMRYCPWCRSKVRRTWPVGDGKHRCSGCRWGVHDEYWSHCPWCARRRSNRPRSR